jgi:NAD(P)-dependent dehydrogenase (short-subunit alcohol dehydrogenase family)
MTAAAPARALIIGASGTLGGSIVKAFTDATFEVWSSGRSPQDEIQNHLTLVGETVPDLNCLKSAPDFDVVVWAQGVNRNDSIQTVSGRDFEEVFNANVGFIVSTLNSLLESKSLQSNARLCVISSIWQEVIRPNKLSYSVSKAAIEALVKSCAVDLARSGYLVNAVLPGVIETPMTRSVLSSEEIERVEAATGFDRLVSPAEIAQTVLFLCSNKNTAITGQSIIVDLGFSNVRPI